MGDFTTTSPPTFDSNADCRAIFDYSWSIVYRKYLKMTITISQSQRWRPQITCFVWPTLPKSQDIHFTIFQPNKLGVTLKDTDFLSLTFLHARFELQTPDLHSLSLPQRREVRCEGEIGREERGDDEGLWQHFWEFYLTLKVVFPFDIFSFSCALTSIQHEQWTSGTAPCVLTTSVQTIFTVYQQ